MGEQKNVLHILAKFGIGGIEALCKDYAHFSSHNNFFITIYSAGVIFDEMERDGYDVYNLNTSNKQYFSIKNQIISYCKEKHIDTVIIHHPVTVMYLMLPSLKRQLPNIKFVVYSHSNARNMVRAFDKKGLKLRKFLARRAMNNADMVVAISESVKKSLQDFLNVKNKINVVYNGINLDKFETRRKYDSALRKLIYVGRLIELKGVQDILTILGNMNGDVDFYFSIVGEGPFEKQLKNKVKELGIEDKVEFVGASREVPRLLREADVFVHLPIVEEGFGISVVEAMATGLVCVCANKGGIPEIVNNSNGYLVSDVDEFSSKLTELLTSTKYEAINDIQSKAIDRAKEFSVEKFAVALDKQVS